MSEYDSDEDKPHFRVSKHYRTDYIHNTNGLDLESMFFCSYTRPGNQQDTIEIWYDIYEDECDPDGCPNYPPDEDVWKRHLYKDELIQAAAHPKRVSYAMSQCEDPEEYFNNI